MIERGSPPAKLHRICSRYGARTLGTDLRALPFARQVNLHAGPGDEKRR